MSRSRSAYLLIKSLVSCLLCLPTHEHLSGPVFSARFNETSGREKVRDTESKRERVQQTERARYRERAREQASDGETQTDRQGERERGREGAGPHQQTQSREDNARDRAEKPWD